VQIASGRRPVSPINSVIVRVISCRARARTRRRETLVDRNWQDEGPEYRTKRILSRRQSGTLYRTKLVRRADTPSVDACMSMARPAHQTRSKTHAAKNRLPGSFFWLVSSELVDTPDVEPVHPAYNPSFLAYFLIEIIFFSHNKSANSVFQPAYQPNRTGP
jgi:hypothetical protein